MTNSEIILLIGDITEFDTVWSVTSQATISPLKKRFESYLSQLESKS